MQKGNLRFGYVIVIQMPFSASLLFIFPKNKLKIFHWLLALGYFEDIEDLNLFLTIYTIEAVTCKILYHDLSLEICVPTSYEWEEERIIRLAVKIQT